MNEELLAFYLKEWAVRSKRDNYGPRGFPKRSLGFSSGGYQKEFSEFEADDDVRIMDTLDVIIYHDLPESQKVMILMVTGQMPKVFSSNRMSDEKLLNMAMQSIWNKLEERGLV